MKKFLISEEEKNRILNLHENMKAIDKERQLELSGKKLNENVSSIVRQLIDNASSAGRISSRVISALDNIAVRRQLKGNYGNSIQDGDDLLDAFIAGRLSNRSADDDAVLVLKKIFTNTDDDQLINQLAKEMVEGDAAFKRGLMDGRYDPTQIYPGKQGQAIENYVNSLKNSNVNPLNPLNPNNFLGGVQPGFIVSKLKAQFASNPKALKEIAKIETELNKYIPDSKADAESIVQANRETIEKLLGKKGIFKGKMMDMTLESLIENPFSKFSLKLFFGILITGVSLGILRATGMSAWTPLKNILGMFGFDDEVEVARQNLCDSGSTIFCNKGQSGGGGSSDDILDPSKIK
jgi:hypothetical protein